MKTKYEILIEKANKCRACSERAETDWASTFWFVTALKLERQADSLTKAEASEVVNL